MTEAQAAAGEEQAATAEQREAQAVEGGGEQEGAAQQQDGEPTMTKTQLKKLKKRQLFEERKAQRKAEEKARRQAEQERKREEGRQRLAAMSPEEAEKYREERNARGAARKQQRQDGKAKMEKAYAEGRKLVIDLDFADYMLDAERKSICKQVGYSWHANCAAAEPVHLVLTSVQGTMREYMDRQVNGYRNWRATVTEQGYLEHFACSKDKLVYLTADSEHELQELDPEDVYVIGGIVDRNRHKMLCFNRAEEQGIRHARLPIGEYMRLASSQVMTTNHVVAIMLKWLELRDWKRAFEAVIPNRKRKHDGTGGEAAGDEEEEGGRQEEAGEGDARQQQQQQQQQQGATA